MDDDFFDNDNKGQAEPVFQDENPHEGKQQQGGDDDDFFGGGDSSQHAQQNQPQHQEYNDDFFGGGQQQQQQQQQTPSNNYANAFDNQQQFSNNQYGSSSPQQQNIDMFDATDATPQQISEHEERRMKLQKEEQERTQKLIQKQSEENTQKSKIISTAKSYLANWKSERDTNIQSRKKACLQEEEVLIGSRQKVTYKNPWDKVTQNISLKASDYPGAKDVTRMKESILNKKADLSNQN